DLISSKQNELTREQVEAIGRILNSPSDSSTDTKAPVADSIVEPASKDIVKQLITKKMFNSVDGKPDLRNIRFELDQAIKSVYGEMLTMLIEAEMDAHIGAGKWGRVSAEETTSNDELGEASNESNEANPKEKRKYRNGSYGRKVRSSMGDLTIKFPRDRDSSFNSIVLPKGEKDTFAIEEQIWFLASQGNSARDIANTIERMMGCKVSHEYVNNVIAAFESRYNEWASRTLEAFYPFVFVDCLYLNVRNESGSTQNKPVYVILGINKDGHKDILDIAM
ncbi:transposase, partial [Anaerobiospirillum succiniciproducens]